MTGAAARGGIKVDLIRSIDTAIELRLSKIAHRVRLHENDPAAKRVALHILYWAEHLLFAEAEAWGTRSQSRHARTRIPKTPYVVPYRVRGSTTGNHTRVPRLRAAGRHGC